MPTESADNLPLEIGHVLFIHIVGYSRLLIEGQKERLNQLTIVDISDGTGRARNARRIAEQLLAGKDHRCLQKTGSCGPKFIVGAAKLML